MGKAMEILKETEKTRVQHTMPTDMPVQKQDDMLTKTSKVDKLNEEIVLIDDLLIVQKEKNQATDNAKVEATKKDASLEKYYKRI